MLAKDIADSGVEQVGSGMVPHDEVTFKGINL